MEKQRKYEVKLSDGRIVSRQYAHMLKFPEKYNERRKKYMQESPEARKKAYERTKKWHAKFVKEHGMSYYKWKKIHNEETANENSSPTTKD